MKNHVKKAFLATLFAAVAASSTNATTQRSATQSNVQFKASDRIEDLLSGAWSKMSDQIPMDDNKLTNPKIVAAIIDIENNVFPKIVEIYNEKGSDNENCRKLIINYITKDFVNALICKLYSGGNDVFSTKACKHAIALNIKNIEKWAAFWAQYFVQRIFKAKAVSIDHTLIEQKKDQKHDAKKGKQKPSKINITAMGATKQLNQKISEFVSPLMRLFKLVQNQKVQQALMNGNKDVFLSGLLSQVHMVFAQYLLAYLNNKAQFDAAWESWKKSIVAAIQKASMHKPRLQKELLSLLQFVDGKYQTIKKLPTPPQNVTTIKKLIDWGLSALGNDMMYMLFLNKRAEADFIVLMNLLRFEDEVVANKLWDAYEKAKKEITVNQELLAAFGLGYTHYKAYHRAKTIEDKITELSKCHSSLQVLAKADETGMLFVGHMNNIADKHDKLVSTKALATLETLEDPDLIDEMYQAEAPATINDYQEVKKGLLNACCQLKNKRGKHYDRVLVAIMDIMNRMIEKQSDGIFEHKENADKLCKLIAEIKSFDKNVVQDRNIKELNAHAKEAAIMTLNIIYNQMLKAEKKQWFGWKESTWNSNKNLEHWNKLVELCQLVGETFGINTFEKFSKVIVPIKAQRDTLKNNLAK